MLWELFLISESRFAVLMLCYIFVNVVAGGVVVCFASTSTSTSSVHSLCQLTGIPCYISVIVFLFLISPSLSPTHVHTQPWIPRAHIYFCANTIEWRPYMCCTVVCAVMFYAVLCCACSHICIASSKMRRELVICFRF